MSLRVSISALRAVKSTKVAPNPFHPQRTFTTFPKNVRVKSNRSSPTSTVQRNTSNRPQHPSPACFSTTSTAKNGESSTSHTSPSTMSQSEYERVADRDMNLLHENLEILVEQYTPDGAAWEVEYDSGVMTVTLPPHGTYVINKQPPNQQIWMSSPISGPCRFSYSVDSGKWTHHRKDEVTLGTLLENEIRDFGVEESWEGLGVE